MLFTIGVHHLKAAAETAAIQFGGLLEAAVTTIVYGPRMLAPSGSN